MKIVLVGSFDHWNGLERHYFKYLSQLVTDIELLPFPDWVRNYYTKNILRRAFYKFNFNTKSVIRGFNTQLYNEIVAKNPEIVWIFKGVNILPETLLNLKALGIKLVNYNADHPFIRTFKSSGGLEIEQCVPLYDLFLCYSKDLSENIATRYNGKVKTAVVPFGYEITPEDLTRIRLISEKEEEIIKVCFIGNPDSEFRYELLKFLIDNKVPIDIYGRGWDKYFKKGNKFYKIYDGVYGFDYWATLPKYRVQLNIFRPHNVNSHNMRTFEIPAVGGIQLAPDSRDNQEFFKEGEEIFLYRSKEDLINLSKFLLNIPSEKAKEVREAGFKRCVLENYSYQRRAHDVKILFDDLLAN